MARGKQAQRLGKLDLNVLIEPLGATLLDLSIWASNLNYGVARKWVPKLQVKLRLKPS